MRLPARSARKPAKRSSAPPNVPTLAEAGFPGYEVSPWFAVFMSAATPKPVIAKRNAALLDAMTECVAHNNLFPFPP